MPLDINLQKLLDSLAAAGRKPTHEYPVELARIGYRKLTCDSVLPSQVVQIADVQNISIEDEASHSVKVRVYRPETTGSLPTIVFFHGGGFVMGDLDTHDDICRNLCKQINSVVVAVDYRLAPEHPFPAAIEDALIATKYVITHKHEFGGSDIVAVAGDSAGGNLAAVVAQQMDTLGLRLTAQLLIYPALDHIEAVHKSRTENAHGYFLELETFKWFFEQYAGSKKDFNDPLFLPMKANIHKSIAPAIIIVAEFDPLRDEGKAYGEILNNEGVKAEVIIAEGMIHGFFDMGRWSPKAQEYIQLAVRQFKALLDSSHA
ncbi:alpha/beta hydrolase [Acinetobacter venetianus]|uniref:alpha/beta hydrolase n=1 Tax=Acinetobacter TaxID=469 RepID=UPI0007756FE8|nr:MULTISPECIES: alpha/beta hydrolase [Acinetobacter]KXO80012.1 alpha/beta hydrolase [Acinetobacter venetianus]MCU4473798.1 alpha/beta hydrolase [Acinetobacter bereziniae]